MLPRSILRFYDGYLINGDTELIVPSDLLASLEIPSPVGLIIADPPYGNIVSDDWDGIKESSTSYAIRMVDWTNRWSNALCLGGAFYVWGGIGSPGFRPFFRYVLEVETRTNLRMSTLITWKKRRAYGIQWGYLFAREELAYFVNGDHKKPAVFHVPLLDVKRGYEGYNEKYPAKSEFLRRTNVWDDVTEVLQHKLHVAQKPDRLYEIIIETHTNPGDWVIDLFAGSGTLARTCRKLGRKFLMVEKNRKTFEAIASRLGKK